MIHAVVIDDEKSGVKSLELLIGKFAADVKVVATTTDPVKGIEIINTYRPEIVFLDIYMPGLNGFDMLDALTFKGFYLVFTTAYQENALRALKSNAFDYLLKPIDWEELKNTIERIKKKIDENYRVPEIINLIKNVLITKKFKLTVSTKSGIEQVIADEILYIEAVSNRCTLYLQNGNTMVTNKTLKEFDTELCENKRWFYRINHSFIIKVDAVVRITKQEHGMVIMADKKEISVSKLKKEEFFELFNLK